MENSFKSIVDNSSSILVILPSRPFFDQVAAGLSLYLTLNEIKPTSVISSDPMTVEFNRLIGVNKISKEMGNKNLVIRFNDYQAADIERVSYDIDDGQFKLTVIPKNGIVAPTKDKIDLSYSGGSADLVLLVGGMNESHFPQISGNELNPKEIVHVGNKQLTLSSNKSVLTFSKPSPSVSEVAYELLAGSQFKVSEDAATNLLMGIEDATDSFSAEGVNADTFAIASELLQLGGKRTPKDVKGNYPPGSIPGGFSQRKGVVPESHDQKPEEKQHEELQAREPRQQDQGGGSQNQPQQQQNRSEESQNQPNQQVSLQHQDQGRQSQGSQNKPIQEEVPSDWLQKPKVYKGASVS